MLQSMENWFHVLRWALKAVLIHNRVQMCTDACKELPHTSWPKQASFDINWIMKSAFFGRPSNWNFCNGVCAATYEHVHMSLYIQICTHEPVHTILYLRACKHESVHTNLYAQACTQICTHKLVHKSVPTSLHIQMCMYEPVHTSLYIQICTYEPLYQFPWCCPWKNVFCIALSIESSAYT